TLLVPLTLVTEFMVLLFSPQHGFYECGSGKDEESSGASGLRLIRDPLKQAVWRKLRQLVKQKTRNPKSPLPVPKTRSAFHPHAPFCMASQDQTHRELVYRVFQFQKRNQQFIRTDNETLSIAERVGYPDCAPLGINGWAPVRL